MSSEIAPVTSQPAVAAAAGVAAGAAVPERKQEQWNACSPNHAIHAWLVAEYDPVHWNFKAIGATLQLDENPTILSKPDFNSPWENALRHRALMSIRRWLLSEFPPDSKWWRVDNFQVDAERMKTICIKWPDLKPHRHQLTLDGIVLFTHDRKSYTCIEGNHRLTQWQARHGSETWYPSLYVVESNDLMCWHDGFANTLDEFKRDGKGIHRLVPGCNGPFDPIINALDLPNRIWFESALPWLRPSKERVKLLQELHDQPNLSPEQISDAFHDYQNNDEKAEASNPTAPPAPPAVADFAEEALMEGLYVFFRSHGCEGVSHPTEYLTSLVVRKYLPRAISVAALAIKAHESAQVAKDIHESKATKEFTQK